MSKPAEVFWEEENDWEEIKNIFDKSYKAFDLMRDGKEKEALSTYPFESRFIRKYVSSDVTELTELLKLRLELH